MGRNFCPPTRGSTCILTFCGVLLISGNAFGQGGTCPSGVPSTSCYFVAATGSDANNGTSESTPWLHAPGMANCTGKCASTTPAPGNGFIFRGGDTWHFGNSGASPYTGGTWNWTWSGTNSTCDTEGGGISGSVGTTSGCIYIGVDQTWYSGSSWARPILTSDNPLTPHPGVWQDSVTSCPYQSGTNNNMIANGASAVIWDNFEMTGLCQAGVLAYGQGNYITDSNNPAYKDQWKNFYIHGASHVPFNCLSGGSICSGVIAYSSGTTLWEPTIGPGFVVDGSDSDPGGLIATQATIYYNVFDSIFRYTYQYEGGGCHSQHDNIWEYWSGASDQVAHSNMMECNTDASGSVPNVYFNNVQRHINGPTVVTWFCTTATPEYWFNNIVEDVGGNGNYWDLDQHDSCYAPGSWYWFNNTLEAGTMSDVIPCLSGGFIYNQHIIVDASSGAWNGSSCTGGAASSTNIVMTHATANAQGYTSTNGINYGGQSVSTCANETTPCAPTAVTNSTVGAGANEASYCSALSSAGMTAATRACAYGTTDACSYNATTHTLNCPAQTAVVRPTSAAWDAGAYEYGDPAPPQPPTNVQATAH